MNQLFRNIVISIFLFLLLPKNYSQTISSDSIIRNSTKIENPYISIHSLPFSGSRKDSVSFDSIQIDNKGQKELILFLKISEHNESHGGSYDFFNSTNIEKYEIWNLDSDTLLFSCVTKYNFKCADFNAHSNIQYKKGKCSYKRSFKIDKNGLIVIKSLSNKNSIKEIHKKKRIKLPKCSPLIKKGKYQFINNAYKKQ